ncbi:hypothetical protein SESBI_10040 [Sesbania bispinosa]|nr:hypothetical protein SESBI_10040 [Sesbania bispinosa]
MERGTMIEEKRGLMGRKLSLKSEEVKPSMGTSNSKTAMIYKDITELLKYCPIGLTGSPCSSLTLRCPIL